MASLEVLRRTGVIVNESEALRLLRDAGCSVSEGNRVRFPAAIVEEAIRSAPSRVVLCRRTGEPTVFLEGQRSFFGTGSDLPHTIDLETGERRLSRISDVAETSRLADALPNLDFVMSMALPSDVPSATSDRHAFLAMLENTTKPMVLTAWDEIGLGDILAMAETVAGGREALALNPFLAAYLEPTSPLQHSDVVLRKMLLMADRGLPIVYAPGAVEGASAPVTSAASLVLGTAESLSGLVIAQIRRKGAPVIVGSGSGPLDMKTMVATYSSPEFMLHCMAMAEMAHEFYRLPVWGFAGCTDSKVPDAQAGVDNGLWILWSALSGANLVHDIGYLESGMTCSYEMIVLGEETIGMVRRLLDGISMTPDDLALDVINEVGPGGDYVTAAHTTRHFRSVWYPRAMDRRSYESWNRTGRPTAVGRARDVAKELIASHHPTPLPHGTGDLLRAIVNEADARSAGA